MKGDSFLIHLIDQRIEGVDIVYQFGSPSPRQGPLVLLTRTDTATGAMKVLQTPEPDVVEGVRYPRAGKWILQAAADEAYVFVLERIDSFTKDGQAPAKTWIRLTALSPQGDALASDLVTVFTPNGPPPANTVRVIGKQSLRVGYSVYSFDGKKFTREADAP